MSTKQVPDGFMMRADGALMPIDKVKPEHKLEDEVVRLLVSMALKRSQSLAEFKETALEQADGFRDLVAQQFGATKGGAKGNMTLRSYDGELAVKIQVSETIEFGPELQAAKALIDECIADWSQGSNDNIKVLVNDAFRVNKDKNIDTGRVLDLRRLDISDDKWRRAMEAISDAVRVTGSRRYIRFFHTDENGVQQPILLDLASV